MRILAILLALTATAAADPAHDVDALAHTLLANLHHEARLTPALRADMIFVLDGTATHDATADAISVFTHRFEVRSAGTFVVTFDPRRHVAWFQGVANAMTYGQTGVTCVQGGHCQPPVAFVVHVSGLAIDDHGWKLAVASLTETLDDSPLLERNSTTQARIAIPAQVELRGDQKLAADVASWFPSGLARSAAPAFVYVAGTAPREVASGTGAKPLVDRWDAMKLAVASVEAKVFGDVGFALAEVRWRDRKDHLVPMPLAAIAIRDGGRWRWVVLDFA